MTIPLKEIFSVDNIGKIIDFLYSCFVHRDEDTIDIGGDNMGDRFDVGDALDFAKARIDLTVGEFIAAVYTAVKASADRDMSLAEAAFYAAFCTKKDDIEASLAETGEAVTVDIVLDKLARYFG